MEQHLQGLSDREVMERRERGLGNVVRFQTGRSYLQIVRQNAFTFINTILFSIGVILILMGQWGDALVTAGLVLMNVVVGVTQEGRAKRTLEQIALLARPKATVVREGKETAVDPSEIVVGDLLVARRGDQIVVDGEMVAGGPMEVDESLLTGESDRIVKGVGDCLLSGSFCVTGTAFYEAQRVGADSLLNQMTAEARIFRQLKTPLQRDIDYVIRVLVLVVSQLGILLALSFALSAMPLVEWVRVAAVIVALVPQGLFFMTTVAYAMGALRVSGSGALVQQINAVESTSHVNLLCLDKTGTLTANRIQLDVVQSVGRGPDAGDEALRRILGSYAASIADANPTLDALRHACDGRAWPVREAVPFSSERKWSALAFDAPGEPGAFVLGAPEVLAPHLEAGYHPSPLVEEWAQRGLRVLLFARHPGAASLHDGAGEPWLPRNLLPVGVLGFRDELRPEAQETLQHFADLGIQVKIISGDNPQTVAALARQVGFGDRGRVVSGLDLDGLSEPELDEVAEDAVIFGRITPQQKETLVGSLRRKGYYVAMIGDGVNDVLSLKRAHVGVAMQSGSQATRSVADIILLGDSFASLPVAFREGQRIVNGMEDVVRLLLTRTLYVLLLVIATRIAGVAFPVTPKHNSVLALLTVGIPILAIAAWARPGPTSHSVVRSASHFVLPAAFTVSLVALGIYLAYLGMSNDLPTARTALTTATVLCGLLLIPFVEPPTKAWAGGDRLSGDWRPTLLAVGMLGLYGVILALPVLRGFFELEILRAVDYLIIALVVAIWALAMRAIWRIRLFERLLARPDEQERSG